MQNFEPTPKNIAHWNIGDVVASEDGLCQSIFVGYGRDGTQWWCDVTDEESGFVSPPELKTFVRALPTAIEWATPELELGPGPEREIDIKKPN